MQEAFSHFHFYILVDEYNNTYHHSFPKKLIDAYHSDLTEEIETNPKNRKFLISKNWSRKIFVMIL